MFIVVEENGYVLEAELVDDDYCCAVGRLGSLCVEKDFKTPTKIPENVKELLYTKLVEAVYKEARADKYGAVVFSDNVNSKKPMNFNILAQYFDECYKSREFTNPFHKHKTTVVLYEAFIPYNNK